MCACKSDIYLYFGVHREGICKYIFTVLSSFSSVNVYGRFVVNRTTCLYTAKTEYDKSGPERLLYKNLQIGRDYVQYVVVWV